MAQKAAQRRKVTLKLHVPPAGSVKADVKPDVKPEVKPDVHTPNVKAEPKASGGASGGARARPLLFLNSGNTEMEEERLMAELSAGQLTPRTLPPHPPCRESACGPGD